MHAPEDQNLKDDQLPFTTNQLRDIGHRALSIEHRNRCLVEMLKLSRHSNSPIVRLSINIDTIYEKSVYLSIDVSTLK